MNHCGPTCASCDRLLEAYTGSIAKERRVMLTSLDDSSSEVEDYWKMIITYRRDRREVLLRHMAGHGDDVEAAPGAPLNMRRASSGWPITVPGKA